MENTFNLLKQQRKRQHIPVQKIVDELGYAKSSIYRYEKNEFEHISTDMLTNIAVFINVSIRDLLSSLRRDGYPDDFLDDVINMYKQYYEEKGKTFEEIDLSEFDDVDIDVVQRNLSKQDIPQHTEDLINYIINNLNQTESEKALKLLKVVFNDENL